jgi:dipeptidyl aminopeptidase/acylaminoacyl peptidase
MRHRAVLLLALLPFCCAAASVRAQAPEPEPGPEPVPAAVVFSTEPRPALGGELFVFDLRRLEIYRANADGTDARRVRVDLGDSQAGAVAATASVATVAGVSGAASAYAAIGVFNAMFVPVGLGVSATTATIATGGAAALAMAPVMGISKAIRVAKRRHRPVRTLQQVQPLAGMSADGSTMLFAADVSKKDAQSNLRLIALGGPRGGATDAVRRYRHGGPSPELSPDGRHATYVNRLYSKDVPQVWLLDLETGTAKPLTDDRAPKSFPRFSPDGSTLLFQQVVANEDGTLDVQLAVVPVAGGEARQVVAEADIPAMPAWSPDGTHVAYVSLEDGTIHVAPVDGSGPPLAVTAPGFARLHPTFTADGANVLYLESAAPIAPAGTGPKKAKVGSDFRLRLTRLSDGATWPLDLTKSEAAGPDVLEKTNLFWFRYAPDAGAAAGG